MENFYILQAFYNNIKTVEKLIDLKIDLNYQDPSNEYTALITTAVQGYYEALELLIEAGADLTLKDKADCDFSNYIPEFKLEEYKSKYPEQFKDFILKHDSNKFGL